MWSYIYLGEKELITVINLTPCCIEWCHEKAIITLYLILFWPPEYDCRWRVQRGQFLPTGRALGLHIFNQIVFVTYLIHMR